MFDDFDYEGDRKYIIRFDAVPKMDIVVCSRKDGERLIEPVVYERGSRPALSVLPGHNQDQWRRACKRLGWNEPA